jgi:hypothetical protein
MEDLSKRFLDSIYCTSLINYIRPMYGASKTKNLLVYSEARFRNVVYIYTYIRIIQMMGNIQTSLSIAQ